MHELLGRARGVAIGCAAHGLQQQLRGFLVADVLEVRAGTALPPRDFAARTLCAPVVARAQLLLSVVPPAGTAQPVPRPPSATALSLKLQGGAAEAERRSSFFINHLGACRRRTLTGLGRSEGTDGCVVVGTLRQYYPSAMPPRSLGTPNPSAMSS